MKKKKSPPRMFVLIIFTLVVATVFPRMHTWWQLKNQENDLLLQKQTLLEINQDLTQKAEELESLSAVERLAREKLGMIKPGEQRFIEFNSQEDAPKN